MWYILEITDHPKMTFSPLDKVHIDTILSVILPYGALAHMHYDPYSHPYGTLAYTHYNQ